MEFGFYSAGAYPTKGRYKGISAPKISLKLDLAANAEYVANLVNVNMWL